MDRMRILPEPIRLYKHNEIAYRAVLEQWKETGKAAVIHPTGTGKSFIAFKLAQEHPQSRVCWLSPSEYMFVTQLENLKSATQGYVPENITFITYARLMQMDEEALEAIEAQYIVLDEFHRCGAAEWGKGVERLLHRLPDAYLLGLSATHIRYLDHQRDMADELFDGSIASNMSLVEAIARGILPAPKYVISLYACREALERYERRVRHAKQGAVRQAAEQYLDALRRAVEKARGLPEIFSRHMEDRWGKYIIFCAGREQMESVKARIPEWFGGIDVVPHVYEVYSQSQESQGAFEAFKADESDHLKLLLCIDMLNEGVHVKNIAGVILFRPTISPIIYKQQIGRALSASSSRAPVIFDVVNNFENLYSIGAMQEELREIVTFYHNTGESEEIVNETFEIVDEVQECRALFDRLEATLSAPWEMMYAQAQRFYAQYGHLNVPKNYRTDTHLSLGAWILSQRKIRRGTRPGVLSAEQIAKLNAIGMNWDNRQEKRWEKCFERAQCYYEANGDLDVPVDYRTEDGIELGAWISRMRQLRAAGRLNPQREARLEAVGMIWDKVSYIWEKHYLAAMEYYLAYGNLDVPAQYVCADGFKLGMWLQSLRRRQRGEVGTTPLTREQCERMEAIGMRWIGREESQWERAFEQAERYYRRHGVLNVPTCYEINGIKLGKWIDSQRAMRKTGKLSKEKEARMEAIGIRWEKVDRWMEMYQRAEAYFRREGRLPEDEAADPEERRTGRWLETQRKAFARGELGEHRRAQLESIGMCWKGKQERRWEENYWQALAYCANNRCTNIPAEYRTATGMLLGVWLNRQKRAYREGRLTAEQRRQLEVLENGSEENRKKDTKTAWEWQYEQASAFFKENGHLNVPTTSTLGRWITLQRRRHAAEEESGGLSQEQERQLEAIGMDWMTPAQRSWENGFEAAQRYFQQRRTLAIPFRYIDAQGYPAGQWMAEQRRRAREGKLKKEQRKRLESMDAHWMTKESAGENAGQGGRIKRAYAGK